MAFNLGNKTFEQQVNDWSMTLEDAKLLGIKELSAEETDALGLGRKAIS